MSKNKYSCINLIYKSYIKNPLKKDLFQLIRNYFKIHDKLSKNDICINLL
jgi:hypothetical protein